jgi:parallel beta-helix repeat protein
VDGVGGGGIFLGSSNPTISYCTIIENLSVQDNGGGIYCYNSSPQIKNCIISDNSARSSYGIGGGIYLNFCSSANIANCIISDNDGGGIGMGDSSAHISNCIISSNSGYWSGGISSVLSSAIIINCLISDNTCFSGWGGGIDSGYSTLSITNSTISGNSAIYGGGISCRGNPSPIILNSIFWGDFPEEVYILENSQPSIMYSTIQGGWPGETNPSWFPAFVDPANSNYHLRDYSSCIGIGTPVGAPNTDIENNKRPNPSGSNPDVGAYEHSLAIPVVPPISLLNIFGFELGNKWIYKGTEGGKPYTVEREITSIDQTSFPATTYVMKIKENGTITGTEWYEYTGNQINLWGGTYEDEGENYTFTSSKGLKAAWFPMMVGDHAYSSAITYILGYPLNISLTADVINKETIALGFDVIEAYKMRYQLRIWGKIGVEQLDFTDSFDWWMAPYLGVVKEQRVDAMVKLTSFAIGGGIITQNSDSDDDNLTDYSEIFKYNTHWQYDDTDGDGMPDGWEVQYGLNPSVDDANSDLDGDGFTNIIEYNRGTDPSDPNSHPSKAMPWIPLLLLDD